MPKSLTMLEYMVITYFLVISHHIIYKFIIFFLPTGAGQNFAMQLLKQFNPAMSDGDAKTKAQKMFATTKGKKVYKIKKEFIEKVFGDYHPHESELTMSSYQAVKICKMFGIPLDEMYERPKWLGGTESEMFNQLEEIAGNFIIKIFLFTI